MAEPEPTRPHMPGYDEMLDTGGGLIPWATGAECFSAAHNYWLATTRPDGRPHVMPVWGVWLDSSFLFSTGPQSRKARNLAANAHCVVAAEDNKVEVILEGTAETVRDAALLKRMFAAYKTKYDWQMDGSEGPVLAVRPKVAFAFVEDAGATGGSPTRWTFND